MVTNSVSLYSLKYKQTRTYGVAALFIAREHRPCRNCATSCRPAARCSCRSTSSHSSPAYKYGWKVGLLTAVASPLINSALFAMPAAAVLPAILTKSILLAAAAGFTARRFRSVSLMLLLGVVLFYQLFGSAVEWALSGSLAAALQDFRIGIPGMLLQIIGGYLLIKHLK